MADCRLPLRKVFVDLADAQRRALLREQIKHAQARWVGQRLQSLRKRVCLDRGQCGRRKIGLDNSACTFFFGKLLCRALSGVLG